MTPKKTTSVLEDWAQRRTDLFELQRQLGRLQFGHEDSAQQLRAAEQAIADYHRDVAEGRRQAVEADERALIDAKQLLAGRLRIDERTGKVVDPKVEAELVVMRRQVRDAEAGLKAWIIEHREQITIAMLDDDRAGRDEIANLPEYVRTMARRRSRRHDEWVKLTEALGIDAVSEMPGDPLSEVETAVRAIADKAASHPHLLLAAPWSLIDDADFGSALAPGKKSVTVPRGSTEPAGIAARRALNRPRPDSAA